MEFTNEMIQKAKQASSAEELLAMAKEEGVALTAEEAEKYFAFLQGGNELPDEALEAVAGGKGEKPTPKYRENQRVVMKQGRKFIHWEVQSIGEYEPGRGYKYLCRTTDYNPPQVVKSWLWLESDNRIMR